MVFVHPDQRNLQTNFWRFSHGEPLFIYEINTVTYGLASSAYLATRALQGVGHICKDI